MKHEDYSFLFHAIKANGGRRFIVGILVLLGCYAAWMVVTDFSEKKPIGAILKTSEDGTDRFSRNVRS